MPGTWVSSYSLSGTQTDSEPPTSSALGHSQAFLAFLHLKTCQHHPYSRKLISVQQRMHGILNGLISTTFEHDSLTTRSSIAIVLHNLESMAIFVCKNPSLTWNICFPYPELYYSVEGKKIQHVLEPSSWWYYTKLQLDSYIHIDRPLMKLLKLICTLWVLPVNHIPDLM